MNRDRRLDQPLGARNAGVVEAARLHRTRDRRERGQALIEGPNLLSEALSAGVPVRVVFAAVGDRATFDLGVTHGIDVQPVGTAAMARLADTDTPRGPVAMIDIPEVPLPATGHVLVAHGVSDPGNLGALVRTAAAFGWHMAYTAGTADPWSPKALRAGAGGHFRVAVTRLGESAWPGERTTVATVVSGGVAPSELPAGTYAVLIGDESSGLPDPVVEECDVRLTIPMPGGAESLNAAVAAGIVVYALSRG